MSEKEMLQDFMELFPVEGQVVPYIELKFRLASKFGVDKLDELLKKLVDKEILTRFEFNSSVNYKAKKEIPVALSAGGSSSAGPVNADQLTDLSKLVVALAEVSENSEVKSLLDTFKSKYNL